ncbi:MAG: hypothetical protein WBN89_08995 [Prochlorococcaceae cyanobacterium]
MASPQAQPRPCRATPAGRVPTATTTAAATTTATTTGWLARVFISSALLLSLLLALLAGVPAGPAPALAAGVEWREVPASEAGRQWWDAGSLRRTPGGNLSVLSRFQPTAGDGEGRPRLPDLYVMEIDCGQTLYRDTSVNGLPRFRAEWQPAGGDPLLMAVIEASCEAGAPLLQAG